MLTGISKASTGEFPGHLPVNPPDYYKVKEKYK